MASNVGRMGLRSGSPSFLVIGLSLVIVVLLYSYWSVSSRNSMLLKDQTFLQDRLRTLTSQKSKVEQKYVAARSQMTDVEKAKRKLEAKDLSSSQKQAQLDSKIKGLEIELQSAKERFRTALTQGEKSKSELTKLKNGIQETKKKFQDMKIKANQMMQLHQKLNERFKLQSQELMNVKNKKEMLQVQLDQGASKHQHQEFKPKVNVQESNDEQSPRQKPKEQPRQILGQRPGLQPSPSLEGEQGPPKDHQTLGKRRFSSSSHKFHALNRKQKLTGLNDIKSIVNVGQKQHQTTLNTSKSSLKFNTTNKANVSTQNTIATPSLNTSINATQHNAKERVATPRKGMQYHINSTIKAVKNSSHFNNSNPIGKSLVSSKSINANTTTASVLAAPTNVSVSLNKEVTEEPSKQTGENSTTTPKTGHTDDHEQSQGGGNNEEENEGESKDESKEENKEENKEESKEESKEENQNQKRNERLLRAHPLYRNKKFGNRFGMQHKRNIPKDE